MQSKPESTTPSRRWQSLLLSRLTPEDRPGRLFSLSRAAFFGLAAYLFASNPLLFSVNPLTAALLCAAEGSDVWWVLGGLLLGLWQGGGSYWYAIGALGALALRWVVRLVLFVKAADGTSPGDVRRQYIDRLRQHVSGLFSPDGLHRSPAPPMLTFDEPIPWRAAIAVIGALIPCLAIPIQGGLAYYDLYGAVFYLSLTPALTTLLALAVSSKETTAHIPRKALWSWVGRGILLGGVCLCGRTVMVLGLSPVVVLIIPLCLAVLGRFGLAPALGAGLWCGLCYDALTIPMLLLFLLIFALLLPRLEEFCALPATLAGMIYLLLCGDATAFWRLSPSLIAGCLLVLAGQRIHRRMAEARSATVRATYDATLTERIEEQMWHERLIHRLSAMSGAFSHLSEMFRQLESQNTDLSPLERHLLCAEALDNHCQACPLAERCADLYALAKSETIKALALALQESGKPGEEQFEKKLRAFCPQKPNVLEDIHRAMAQVSYEKLRTGGGDSFAFECDEIAHLLRDVIRLDHAKMSDPRAQKLAEAVRTYLDEQKIAVQSVVLLGSGPLELRLLGIDLASLPLPEEQFRADLAKILGAPVSHFQHEREDGDMLTLRTLPILHVDYTHRNLAAAQSSTASPARVACGDTLRVFVSEQDLFCALLCDGMGKGRRAAQASGLCGLFLESLLKAGVEIQTALRMFNHYLLAQGRTPEEEICTTVDLFVLNLHTGQGCFVKSGAAPSLILRDGRLFRLCAHTLPIGILQAVDVQIIPFDVKKGDHILLMSDGVCDTEEGEGGEDWLADYLSGAPVEDDSALIHDLFAKARAHGSDDDMSVISIHISKES